MKIIEKKQTYIYLEDLDRKKFLHWLIDNDMNVSDFAKKAGTNDSYIHRIIKGEISISEKTKTIFKKGGYEL